LTLSRRPGWFAGAEQILETYVVTIMQVRFLEAELRKTEFNTPAYKQLLRLHHKTVALASSLAIRLRLVPSSRLDKNQPHDGDNPVA
jgi:hypothetical protein